MQRWEYYQMTIFQGEWWDSAGSSGKLRQVGSARMAGNTFYDAVPTLDSLGAAGWELVGMAGTMGDCVLFFKRPKP